MIKVLTISTLAFLTFFAGIIRHDVDEKQYLEFAAEKQFDCVGQIFKDTSAAGSCVLINDRFVLSAAHVFIDSDTRLDTMDFDGNVIVVYVPYNKRVTDVDKLYMVFKGQKVRAKKLTLHPYYLDSLTKGTCDIAIIELEQPITTIQPANLNIIFDELNSNVVGVGFGASGIADKPESVNFFNKKIAGENVIDSISGQKYLGYEIVFFCDFDHPTRDDCNKLGNSEPRPLEYISTGGDSGGGLFRKKDKAWELIGICTGGGTIFDQFMKTGYYGQIMEWTRVSAFNKWIEEQTR